MKFNVDFAGLSIEVNCKYDYTKEYCKNYLTYRKSDYSISVSEADIQNEIDISDFTPSPGYAESICVYREVAKRLPDFKRMVFHGAVIELDGKGYMFTAPSGTGKTTHIMLWEKLFGAQIVNGDKPILHIENGIVTAYATPYAGKEHFENHSSVNLSGICIIHRGEVNKIRRVKAGEVLSEIVSQMYLPPTALSVNKTLDLLSELVESVPVYVLECNISDEAAITSYEAMTGKKYED
ncbi:MAG: hypothetical protein IJT65_07815 [Eubacterium sp.]|nr:hypothetical protein [Eubacterium sp.]